MIAGMKRPFRFIAQLPIDKYIHHQSIFFQFQAFNARLKQSSRDAWEETS